MRRVFTSLAGAAWRSLASLRRLETVVFVAVTATVAAVHWEDALLTNSLSVRASGSEPGHYPYWYDDQANGGTSKVAPAADRPWSWSCSLTRAYEFPYCGYGFTLTAQSDHGIDLSEYDSVRLSVDHSGPGNLMRIYLKNYNPAYSRPGIPQTDKYNVVDTALIDGAQTITLPLSSFTVADWWKTAAKIPPALATPEITNAVAFEVQNGLDGRPGEYKTSITEVTFEKRILSGREFYTAISIVWLGLLACLLWHNRKEARRRQKIDTEQFKWASEHDALTGLPNRRAFQSRLEAATLRLATGRASVALLLIDLDHFKHVNDSLGHAAGDDLLKSLAERLTKAVRACDFVGRIGGDEFAVILESVDGEPDALARGNEVLAKVLLPAKVAGRMVRTGASIGGAVFPEHAESAGDLFKAADTALYALKAEGRGGTKMFAPHMLQDAERKASQLEVARTAVSAESVLAHYQPKVDLATRSIVGFEALLRCTDGTTLHLPEAMEAAFEDYELAAKLGELMQRQVAQDLSSWLGDGLDIGPISINAAPAEFLRNDYAARLLHVLQLYGVPPSSIEVEVTEHVFLGRCADYVTTALASLKQAGVNLSLDDFGTGYSSLSHLRDMPIDSVKIDRSFVDRITDDSEAAAIVSAIVSLSRTLKLGVVAEGVETTAQSDLLRALGCPHGQGYLFSAPVRKEDVKGVLRRSSLAA